MSSLNPLYVDFDEDRALAEGWCLFEVDDRLQLQRVDDPFAHDVRYNEPIFQSDAEAIIHVAKQAGDGSQFHMDALHLVGKGYRV